VGQIATKMEAMCIWQNQKIQVDSQLVVMRTRDSKPATEAALVSGLEPSGHANKQQQREAETSLEGM